MAACLRERFPKAGRTAVAVNALAEPHTPQKEAEELIRKRMAAFHLRQLDHDLLFGVDDRAAFRRQFADLIERLQP